MSFSSDTKTEIAKTILPGKRQRLCEIAGFLCFSARIKKNADSFLISVPTENPKVARLLYSLLKTELLVQTKIKIHKGSKNAVYEIVVGENQDVETALKRTGLIHEEEGIENFLHFHINPSLVKTPQAKKAFLRGAFLAAGSVIAPEKNYHLEFATSHYQLSKDFFRLLSSIGLSPKTVVRKSNYVLYFKNSEEIADILTMLGAFNALMYYHNIRIVKDMRNNINRTVNCENANLTKTVDASVNQVLAIEALKEHGELEKLSPQLKEIALLRLEYRELSLKELGTMLSIPIGKSGVNHRLRKLVELAEKYK